MLELILLILKVLGTFLLVILGIILVLLFLVLLLPLKYGSSGMMKDGTAEVRALFTYLNPFVRISICYPSAEKKEAADTKTKIFGVTLLDNKEKKAERKENKTKSGTGKKRSRSSTVIKKKQKRFAWYEDAEYYLKLLEENRELILDVIHTVLNALATVLPKDMYVRAVFGTGSADITGFVYGAYCAVQNILPGKIYVEPVWTEQCFEGEYRVKGSIRLIPFVIAAIRIIADKNVRLLYKKLRRV